MDLKRIVIRLTPSRLHGRLSRLQDRLTFMRLETLPCDVRALAHHESVDWERLFDTERCEREWRNATRQSPLVARLVGAQGVSAGEARAIYHLIRYFDPCSVLEIGTHIGASTVRIAAALRANGKPNPRLVTVDIKDVNDPSHGDWARFGAPDSPAAMITQLECRDFVEFVAADSLAYLDQCNEKFDFIFLDGSHRATVVYQEICRGLSLLNDGGRVLLHDFFPEGKPLWPNGAVIPGPFLATQKLQAQNPELGVVPLGELPWTAWPNGAVVLAPFLATQCLQAESPELIVLSLGDIPWSSIPTSKHTCLALLVRRSGHGHQASRNRASEGSGRASLAPGH